MGRVKNWLEEIQDNTKELDLALEQLQQEITTLKADLAKFAGHTAKCKIHTPAWTGSADVSGHHPDMRKCDCGWAELERTL